MTSDQTPTATTPTSNLPPEFRPVAATTAAAPPAEASAPVMRDAIASKQDAANRAFAERNRSAMIKSMVITAGVVIAPFMALIFGLNAALGVLVLALAFTTIVTVGGARRAGTSLRTKLYTSALLNGVIAVVVAIFLLLRLSV